jgi:hypothetical protein
MTTKQLAELRKEAYNVAYSHDGSVNLPDGLTRFLEVYENKKVIAEFNEQPSTWLPYDKPVKKAKEIALEAAVKINCGCLPPQGGVVNLAKEIYEWLTEPETDQR